MTVGQLVPFLFIGVVFTIWFVKQLDELARELHSRHHGRLCKHCQTSWPCATAQLIYREDELRGER